MPVRLLIVDDHQAVRDGLGSLLSESEVQVVGKAKDASEALNRIQDLRSDSNGPDLVLLDVQLPQNDGISFLAQLRDLHPELPVVMFSAFEYPIYIARATANGAQDFVFKDSTAKELVDVLTHAVKKLGPYPSGALNKIKSKLSEIVDPKTLPQEFPLTSREVQVLRHVAMGLSNREIAQNLSISVETVKEHVQNILRKTQANDRTDAAVRAVRAGLVD